MFLPSPASSIIYAAIAVCSVCRIFAPVSRNAADGREGCGIRGARLPSRSLHPSLALELELESWHSMTTMAKGELPDCGALLDAVSPHTRAHSDVTTAQLSRSSFAMTDATFPSTKAPKIIFFLMMSAAAARRPFI